MRSLNPLAIALAAALALWASGPMRAADDPKKAELEKQKAELQRQMAEAKKQLKEATKQIAELSKKMAEFEGQRHKVRTFSFMLEDRPRLGVLVQTDANPSTDSKGALLEGVTPGGPAEEAGLKAGDIIVKFNGQKLAGPYEDADEDESAPGIRLIDLARTLKEGDKVSVEYLRGKETKTATFAPRVLDDTLAFRGKDWARDYDFEIPEIPDVPEDFIWVNMPRNWLNMELVALNPELGEYFGTAEGLLVVKCEKDSSLQLRPGDVLLKIGDHKVATPSQAYRVLRNYEPGESATLDIIRKQKRQTLSVKVPEEAKPKTIKEKRRIEAPVAPAPPPPPSPPASTPRARGHADGESTQA